MSELQKTSDVNLITHRTSPPPIMTDHSLRLPKLLTLTEDETITDYAKWQSNLKFHLSLRNEFAPFLDAEWSTVAITNRGLVNDTDAVAENQRKTAAQKKIILERMLEFIGQFAPSLLYREILKNSTCLNWVWTRIQRHYGFVQSEANFLELHRIQRLYY